MRIATLLLTCLTFVAPTGQSQETVYVIPLTGEVELGLYHVFERGFEEADESNASLIVIDMDTPGGRVDAAWEICELLLNSETLTAVLVTGDATSAGAMIALAAEKIFMTPNSTIGTAAPIIVGPGGGGEGGGMIDKKALSFVLAKFRSIAEKRGRDVDIAEAMVDPQKEVQRTGPDGDIVIVSEEGTLLTFTTSEAVKWGVADAKVDDLDDMLERLGLADAEVIRLHEKWFERFARFITSMTVSGLLLSAGILGIFMELRTPGFGIFGIVGILCIMLFFWGHLIATLAGWEGPLLFLVGIGLLAVELFITPGFGIFGISGIVLIFISFVITLLGRSPLSPYFFPTMDWDSVLRAVTVTMAATAVGIIGFMLAPFLLPAVSRTGLGRRLVLAMAETRKDGYHSHSTQDSLENLVGQKGVAYTTLRPAGMAMIDGNKIDVVSEGGFITRDQQIEVIRIEGRRIVVRPV